MSMKKLGGLWGLGGRSAGGLIEIQKLDRAQVHTGLQKMGGESGTKAVNATALFKPYSFLRRAEDVPGLPSA